MPELAFAPLFPKNDLRAQNRRAMIEAVEPVIRSAPVSIWLDKLNEADVPCVRSARSTRSSIIRNCLRATCSSKSRGKSGRNAGANADAVGALSEKTVCWKPSRSFFENGDQRIG